MVPTRHGRGVPASSRGGSIVELTISLPVLVLLVLGVADVGRAYFYREAVANAARQALRVAVSHSQQGTADAVCGSSGGQATAPAPAPAASPIATIVNDAAVESSSDGTASGSAISGATITVTWHCNGAAAVTNASNGGTTDPASPRSDAVEVQVSYAMPLVTMVLQPTLGSALTIRADVIGRSEY